MSPSHGRFMGIAWITTEIAEQKLGSSVEAAALLVWFRNSHGPRRRGRLCIVYACITSSGLDFVDI